MSEWHEWHHTDIGAANAEIDRLRAIIRVNTLRWVPDITHAEIDAMLNAGKSDIASK